MAKKDNAATNGSEHSGNYEPLTINAQYLKDLSFENPSALKSFEENADSPEINVGVNVSVNQLVGKTCEVCLGISAEAKRGENTLFVAEVEYAGVFTLGDIPDEAVHPVLMIECPRLLFPYARSILATITREGGFPALSLNPVDFVEMYRQQLQSQANQEEKTNA